MNVLHQVLVTILPLSSLIWLFVSTENVQGSQSDNDSTKKLTDAFLNQLINQMDQILHNLTTIHDDSVWILDKLKRSSDTRKNDLKSPPNQQPLNDEATSSLSNVANHLNITQRQTSDFLQNLKTFGKILFNPNDSQNALKILSQNDRIRSGIQAVQNKTGISQNFFDDLLTSLFHKTSQQDVNQKQPDVLGTLLNPCARANCSLFRKGLLDLMIMSQQSKYRSVQNYIKEYNAQQDTVLTLMRKNTSKTGNDFFDKLINALRNASDHGVFGEWLKPCEERKNKAGCLMPTSKPAAQNDPAFDLNKFLNIPKFNSLSDFFTYVFDTKFNQINNPSSTKHDLDLADIS